MKTIFKWVAILITGTVVIAAMTVTVVDQMAAEAEDKRPGSFKVWVDNTATDNATK